MSIVKTKPRGQQTWANGTLVEVELDWDAPEPRVHVHLMNVEGSIYSQDLAGFDFLAVEKGAAYGVRYALRVAAALPCGVRVTEIRGTLTDTNPTIVAAAAANATWRALAFEPQQELRRKLFDAVRASTKCGGSFLGTFDT